MSPFLLAILLPAAVIACTPNDVSESEWNYYKSMYAKVYPNPTAESNARYYYGVNKEQISAHNYRFALGFESYNLGINQYSDLRFTEIAALFPPTTEIASHGVPFKVPNVTTQTSFSYASLGFVSAVLDQRIFCNSGWAHAAASAIQIYDALITGNLNAPILSPQNLIDCAGSTKACTNQVSQTAFDYLTMYLQRIYPLAQYPLSNAGQGMCILPNSQAGKTLASYSNIAKGDDTTLKKVVNYIAPVVIKVNPASFGFMHYKLGIFTQPAPIQEASHYMTVVGFGTDITTGKDYWLIQNSFGTTWGENGYVRIERDSAKPITNSAIFPHD